MRYRVSAARIAANRRNALRSTGPRSEAGKAASARNATRHGAWAKGLQPIRAGAFAEDEAEVSSFVEEFVADLAPRGRSAEAQAREIAALYWRFRRLDRLEASAIAHDSAPTLEEATSIGYYEELEFTATIASNLTRWLNSEQLEGDHPCRDLAEFLADQYWTEMMTLSVPGIWDAATEPATESEWMVVLDAIVRYRWPEDLPAALAWARSRIGHRGADRHLQRRDRGKERRPDPREFI